MRILLTNDDGFDAAGIKSLKKIALDITSEDKIFIVAPSKNQSAKSRSITYKTSFEIIKENEHHYSLDGTPTDCVIFALEHLMKENRPDLILSGINWGYNLSEDVFYSGTVAAALEGSDRGILSIALSQAYGNTLKEIDPYLFAESCGAKLCLSIFEKFSGASEKTAFNVNFPINPNSQYPKCIKVSPAGKRLYSNFKISTQIKSQKLSSALIDTRDNNSAKNSDDDYMSCLNGYVTITPLSISLSKKKYFEDLKKVNF